MTTVRRPPADLAAVSQHFCLFGRFLQGIPYGTGHINDTYVVVFDQAGSRVRYLFQRINRRIFRDVPALMENISRVTAHAAAKLCGSASARDVLTLVPARDGRAFCLDGAGDFWRCYLFIEGARTYDVIESPRQAYEAARAFGAFQRILADLPGPRLHETIPHFHDTPARLAAFERALGADRFGRAEAARADVDFARAHRQIAGVLPALQAAGDIPERITHNDTKCNNVMIDDETGSAICVIDLDTVMPGLALFDFGDLVRTATSAAKEDETDLAKVELRLPYYEQLVAGYLAGTGELLNAVEIAHLPFAGILITFEIGLRFLTDHLEGDIYFKIARPGHNLDRARNQFALVRSIQRQEEAMREMTERLAARASEH